MTDKDEKQKLEIKSDGMWYNTHIKLNGKEIKRIKKLTWSIEADMDKPLVMAEIELNPEETYLEAFLDKDSIKFKNSFPNNVPVVLLCATHGIQRIKNTLFVNHPKYAKMPCGCKFSTSGEDEDNKNWQHPPYRNINEND